MNRIFRKLMPPCQIILLFIISAVFLQLSGGNEWTCAKAGAKLYKEKAVCYWLVLGSFDYYQAAAECEKDTGHLATLYDAETSKFVEDSFYQEGCNNTWMGINDIDRDGQWGTWDGSNISWANWHKQTRMTYPITNGGDCATISSNCQWMNTWCAWSQINALCEYSVHCTKQGAMLYIERAVCYWFVKGSYTYDAARTQCRNDNGHLAMLYDANTTDFVKTAVFSGSCQEAWFGVNGSLEDDNWVTWDGMGLHWTNWYNVSGTVYPKGAKGNCVRITRNCQWKNRHCIDKEYPVLCESDAPIVFTSPAASIDIADEATQTVVVYTETLIMDDSTIYPVTEAETLTIEASLSTPMSLIVFTSTSSDISIADEETQTIAVYTETLTTDDSTIYPVTEAETLAIEASLSTLTCSEETGEAPTQSVTTHGETSTTDGGLTTSATQGSTSTSPSLQTDTDSEGMEDTPTQSVTTHGETSTIDGGLTTSVTERSTSTSPSHQTAPTPSTDAASVNLGETASQSVAMHSEASTINAGLSTSFTERDTTSTTPSSSLIQTARPKLFKATKGPIVPHVRCRNVNSENVDNSRNLKLDKTKQKKYQTKFYSVSDSRVSSKVIGHTGALIICTFAAVLIFFDIASYYLRRQQMQDVRAKSRAIK